MYADRRLCRRRVILIKVENSRSVAGFAFLQQYTVAVLDSSAGVAAMWPADNPVHARGITVAAGHLAGICYPKGYKIIVEKGKVVNNRKAKLQGQ